MDLMILKKKIDGYRAANGSIKNMPPELLLELRQTWEHFTGDQDQFRSELGMKIGTLRKLLVESKKLNHVLASSEVMGLGTPVSESTQIDSQKTAEPIAYIELSYDGGTKVIRFPNLDLLMDFLRKAS